MYDYSGEVQKYVVPKDGIYKLEAWGAQGGSFAPLGGVGGKGAYVKGNIELKKDTVLYIYVGQYASYASDKCYGTNPNTVFNGSRLSTCTAGGGATDFRLEGGEWDNFDSLKSRIMVAAGGGGATYGGYGGYGGGLTGGDAYSTGAGVTGTSGHGATQTQYTFGISNKTTSNSGNGYYSGEAGHAANAGGGSSFISGYPECNAISLDSTEKNIIHTGQPIHYSGLYFTDSLMVAGNATMPNPRANDANMVGNANHGYARITKIGVTSS